MGDCASSGREPAPGTVVILGSINIDLLVSTDRLPVAGETVVGTGIVRQLGGKGANQAVGATAAGADCRLLGRVGSDPEGAAMMAALVTYGVDTRHVGAVSGMTGCAVVTTSRDDNQIVVIAGANGAIGAQDLTDAEIAVDDVCLAQLETPVHATAAFFALAREHGATTILNAAPASLSARQLLPLTDLLVVNETELLLLAEAEFGMLLDDTGLIRCVERLEIDGGIAVVTLGARGAAIVSGGRVRRVAGRRVRVLDTTGAGDCFCGYLAAALARGDDLETAVEQANAAASIAVQALGAASSMPSREAVQAALSGA